MRSRVEVASRVDPIHSAPPIDGTNHGNYIEGTDQGELIRGFGGDDTIDGRGGADTILGGLGDDYVVSGGSGDDYVDGGVDDDLLYGGSGIDTLLGGDGDDYLSLGDRSGTADGGAGVDTASILLSGNGAFFDAAGAGSGKTISIVPGLGEAGSTVTLTDIEQLIITGTSGADYLIGGDGADTIDSTGNDDVLKGNGGNDLLIAREGDVTMLGGAGDDLMVVDGAQFDFPTSHYAWAIGGDGFDTVSIYARGSTRAFSFSLSDTGLTGRMTGPGGFSIDGEAEAASISSGNAADTLLGGSGDDYLDAYMGHDSVDGGGGDDVIAGEGTLLGGSGDDIISDSWGGADTVDGGEGHDLFVFTEINLGDLDVSLDFSGVDLSGTAAVTLNGKTDMLTGIEGLGFDAGWGNDSIIGTAGDDRMDGSYGADTLRGGLGDDTFLNIARYDGVHFDKVDIYDGGAGVDTISYATSVAAVSVDLGKGTGKTATTSADTLIAIENAIGGVGRDVLTGSKAANLLDGGAGNDRLSGEGGADTLMGGQGADVLRGGGGKDVFLFTSVEQSSAATPDFIQDLEGKDLIDLGQIDARTDKDGDQAFHLVSAFDGKSGDAILSYADGVTTLSLDVDGDGLADMAIKMAGDQTAFDQFVL